VDEVTRMETGGHPRKLSPEHRALSTHVLGASAYEPAILIYTGHCRSGQPLAGSCAPDWPMYIPIHMEEGYDWTNVRFTAL
jgi:hypothetical protein